MRELSNVIFDADGTLLKGENPYLALAKKLNCYDIVMDWVNQYLNNKISYKKLLDSEIEIFIKQHALIYGSSPHTGDFERLSTPPEIRKGVDTTIRKIITRGIKPFILSSGFRYIIKELSKISISPERVYANRFLYDGSGHFVTIQTNVDARKVAALKRMKKEFSLDLTETAYVGDNEFDRPAIEYMLSKGGTVFFLNDSNSIFKIKNKPKSSRFVQIDKLSGILDYLGKGEAETLNKEISKLVKDKRVVMMCGLPGTGKSVIAKDLAKNLGFKRISSNQIRLKELFPNTTKYGRGYGKDDYFEIRKKVYKVMLERAESLAKENKKIVLDGTYMDDFRSQAFSSLKKIAKTKDMAIVVVKTDEELIMERNRSEKRKDLEALMRLFESWKRDTLIGKFWYPRKINYKDILMIEVENGKVVKVMD